MGRKCFVTASSGADINVYVIGSISFMTHSLIGRIRPARLILATNKIGPSASPIIPISSDTAVSFQCKTNKKSKSKKRNSASVYINRNKNKKNPSTVCSSNWLVIRQQSCSDTVILTPPMMVDDSARLYPLEHIVTCN